MKKVTRLSLMFAVAILATGCLRRDYMALGEQAMTAEDYRTAEIYFRKAIQRNPRSDQAFYDLGTAYLKELDYNFSYQAFTRAAELNPSNAAARVETGKILLLADQPARAEHEAREALKFQPRLLSASLLLGEALVAENSADAARSLLEQAVRRQPGSGEAYVALAALESRQQNSDKALANLDKAIAADPHNSDAYVAKANYLSSRGELKQALLVLRQGVRANPMSDRMKLVLAEMLLSDHQFDEGTAILRSLAAHGSQKPAARARLALAEVENNQLKAAAHDLKLLEEQGFGSVPEVLYARGRLALAQNKLSDAQHLFTDLTDIAPKFAPGFYYLGLVYAQSGQLQKASDTLQAATKLAPNLGAVHVLLGRVELQQGYYPATLEESAHALQYDPTSVPALQLKGDALYAMGRNEEAEDVFQTMTRLAPSSSVAHERLGQLAVKRKDLNTAAAEFETAFKLDPSRVELLDNLALALVRTKGPQSALDRLRAAVRSHPNNSAFRALLALYLIRNSQPAAAVPELKTGIDQDPSQSNLYILLARAYQMTGKTEEATAELKASLVKRPKYVPTLMMLAIMADQAGQVDEAIGYYEKLVALTPNFGPAANNLAYDYLRENKNLDQALDLAQRARQLMPHDPHVADTLGEVFMRRGLPDNAVPLFRESVQANGNSPTPHYHLGFALLAIKQNSEAGEELNTALRLGPNAQEASQAREALARLEKK